MNSIHYDIEKYYRENYKFVAGVDEAGRGALAGPVVAAAVILDDLEIVEKYKITDSKSITAKKRDALFDVIHNHSIAIGVGIVSNLEIDNTNILKATMKAMSIAISQLNVQPEFLLIDGNYFNASDLLYKTIVKGDLLCPSISAASIIAKVTRDRIMIDISRNEFPEYDFDRHKGYAVASHYKKIEEFSICKYHRTTFLKKLNTTDRIFI